MDLQMTSQTNPDKNSNHKSNDLFNGRHSNGVIKDKVQNSYNSTEREVGNYSPHNSSLRFGWKALSCNCLQVFNNPIFFLTCACLAVVGEGFVLIGMTFATLTSVERQFGYSSSQVAMFTTAYEIAVGIVSIFIGYLGHRHKPRCIGISLVIMAVGSVIVSVPKFVIGPYKAGIERTSDFCTVANTTNSTTTCHASQTSTYTIIFTIAFVIMGIGSVTLWTLIPPHLEEVTSRARSSLFIGIYYALNAVGPALGYIVANPILKKWVDLKQPLNSSLQPTDTNWVGAWWLGFLIGAGILLLPVLPMLGFPKEFPDTDEVRHRKLLHEDIIGEDENLKHDLKSVWPAIKALLGNTRYLFLCLAIAAESLAVGGFAAFLPKLVHVQFHVTESQSSLYTGVMTIPGGAVGILLGGYIVKRNDWNCKQILRFATIMAFISAVLVVFSLVGCEGRKIVGQQDDSTGLSHNFTQACNKLCGCSTDLYKPICSVEDQQTYFSPCHAGCQKSDSIVKEYFNCTCFPNNVTRAVNGRCTEKCVLFPLFAVGMVLLMLCTFMNNVPMVMATLRVVNAGQGSFALGVQQVIVRFLGFVPGPIMFGALIDESCILWHRSECSSKTSNCLEYNQANFRYYMFAGGIATKFASFVFIFLAYKIYRLPERTTIISVETLTPGASVIENPNVYTIDK